MSEGMMLRWWSIRSWFRRCPECHRRGYGDSSPRWENDRVAQMLGIAYYGCPSCGKGSIEERDSLPSGTCPSRCVAANHPGREHDEWVGR